MQDWPSLPSEPPVRASGAAARPVAREAIPTRKEGQSCSPAAVVLCRAEARLRCQKKPIGVRCAPLWSRTSSPLNALRSYPQSVAANARHEGEPGRTHLLAASDAHLPTQAPNPAQANPHRARREPTTRRPCWAAPPSVAAPSRRGTPFGYEEQVSTRPGGPPSTAAPGSPGRSVPRHSRHLRGGVHPVADAHGGAADRPRVRPVRARCRLASARPETAAAARPEARIRRA